MRLTLHYRGPLKANGSPQHKHVLRKVFHQQLAVLWEQKPLLDHKRHFNPKQREGDYCMVREMQRFKFVPLVTAEMDVIAEIEVLLLRPERPGGLLTQGGDIDNRLKTLFDALSMPQQANSMPPSATPEEGESPFYCLLENDNLVTSVAVKTEQLLEPGLDSSLVDALIRVRTRITRPTMGNGAFA